MRNPLLPWFALLAALPVAAASDYRFDQVHSQVQFRVSHLGFSMSEGEFHEIEGGFRFDAEDWSKSICDVRIGVASIDLDDDAWNRTLLGERWFDAERYPQMRYRCLAVVREGERDGRIEGELSLRGITRPVTLRLRFNRAGVHKYSLQQVAGFEAHATLKRSDFGMTRFLPEIGDDIEIRLDIEGIREGRKRDRKK